MPPCYHLIALICPQPVIMCVSLMTLRVRGVRYWGQELFRDRPVAQCPGEPPKGDGQVDGQRDAKTADGEDNYLLSLHFLMPTLKSEFFAAPRKYSAFIC